MDAFIKFLQAFFSFVIISRNVFTVKFILPFTIKKSIKIPDFKDSNALFVFIYHTRFSLVNCDDGF